MNAPQPQTRNGRPQNQNKPPPAAQSKEIVDPRQMALKAHLGLMQAAITSVLPKHMTAERLTKVVLSCTARTPKLLECSLPSIGIAVMQAAELGLELGGLLGEAYLVPYGKEAQCIIGYQGLLKLARQSGEIASVMSRVVYGGENVRFDFATNTVTDELTMQEMANRDSHDDNVMGVYCVITLKSGERVLEVMTRDDIDAVRARSKASGSGPWVTDFAMMCRKTVLRRVAHYIPKSSEKFAAALEREIERDLAIDVTDASAAAASSGIADEVMRRAQSMGTQDDAPVTVVPTGAAPPREPGDDTGEEEES